MCFGLQDYHDTCKNTSCVEELKSHYENVAPKMISAHPNKSTGNNMNIIKENRRNTNVAVDFVSSVRRLRIKDIRKPTELP